MSNWITMHWPCPDHHWDRHVYIKEQKSVPQPGDTVFLYEAKYASVDGKRVKTTRRVHRGQRGPEQQLPVGFGGIIGMMTVKGTLRKIGPEDIVYEYGNLGSFSIIPCRGFQEARLHHADLLVVLGMNPKTPPTPFRLCQIGSEQAAALQARLKLGGQQ